MTSETTSAARSFDTDDAHIVTLEGSPDKLAFHDPTKPDSYLAIEEPLDLRDYR